MNKDNYQSPAGTLIALLVCGSSVSGFAPGSIAINMVRSIVFCGVLLFLASVSNVPAQVQIEGWHVYPTLRKCPELVQPNTPFEISVELPPKLTKQQRAEVKFEWSVSADITAGAGTEKITINSGDRWNISIEVDMKSPYFPNVRESCNVSVEPAPKPELEAEINTVGNCEDGSRALQGLLASLANNPSDEGHIVIYTEKNKIRSSSTREREIRSAMKLFGGSYDRLRIVRAELRDNAKTQFWRVPPGAVMHEIEPLDLSGVSMSPKPTEPYIYGMETFDGIAECKIYEHDVNSYADHLKQNPKDRGKIVIRATTRTRFVKKQRGILSMLARRGVPAKRVKTVFAKADVGHVNETVELWVIPAKN